MSVIVTMEVEPIDWAKFQAALRWLEGQPAEGLRSSKGCHGESLPRRGIIIQEWDSHDAFHAASERNGDAFNQMAGTKGLDWRTNA